MTQSNRSSNRKRIEEGASLAYSGSWSHGGELDMPFEVWMAVRDRQIQALFDAALDAMLIANDDGYCINVNFLACQLMGLPMDGLVGQHLANFVESEFDFDPHWTRFLRQGQRRGVLRMVRPDGGVRRLNVSACANFFPHCHLLILRDITASAPTQDSLQSLYDRLQFLLANTPVVFYSCEACTHYRTTFISGNVKELFGLEVEQIIADPALWFDRIHPEDREKALKVSQQALQQRKPISQDYRFLRADGTYCWLRDEIRYVRDTGQYPAEIIGYLMDISDRKHFEFSLQRQAEQEHRLAQVIHAIRSSLDLDIIFSVAAAQISEFLNGEVSIVKYVPERQCWVHQEVSSQGERQNAKLNMEIPDVGNPLAAQLKQFQTVHINNTDLLTDTINQPLANQFPGAWLMTPIIVGETLWGSLTLARLRVALPWSTDEIAMAKHLADQLAIAIHQLELHNQVHQLNTHLEQLNSHLEEQVQERTRQLQQSLEFEGLIKRITDKVRDSLDEQQILQTAVEELVLALDLECCDTGIYNSDKTVSTIVCEYTRALKSARGEAITIAESKHEEMYQFLFAGQVCQICDRLPDPVRADQTHLTILACPIFDRQDVLGDLWLFRRTGQIFTQEEVRLAMQVATQCAIALRQARLYHMAQNQVLELERLHQLKDNFLNTVTHELRLPMSNIKMSTEMLEIQLNNLGILQPSDAHPTPSGHLNASTQRYFSILKEECQREANLINDLLDLARVESGREVLTPMSIQLYLWVSHIAETFLERAQQQGLDLQVMIPKELVVETDLSCLERILTELLHNACKYTPAGETILMNARALAKTLEVSVWNTGVEIPQPEQERIFEKFYRIPGSDPLRHGGTGLGLPLVRELAHYLGGQIQVHSGDRRTGFTLTLPLHSPHKKCPPPRQTRF